MKIKEIIVVEGRDDTTKIQQAADADTIETNGSAINKEILNQVQHAQDKRGVIIFTDPDYPGDRIRHIIDQAVPGCKHAFLTRDKARAKHPKNKSLGIEHASKESIQQALEDVYELAELNKSEITKAELVRHGLIGGQGASVRREKLGELLQIGHTNGKQLLKRLTMFQITKMQFEQAIRQLQQEENENV
ncbi:ribonuclease M5 [Virgibacillus ainsalahensis]